VIIASNPQPPQAEAPPRTIGDLLNAIAHLVDPIDGSVSEDGLTVRLGSDVVRIDFQAIPTPTPADALADRQRWARQSALAESSPWPEGV
jgi:hypothetical protein